MDKYFVHETSIVDDSVSIGGGQKYGISLIYLKEPLLVRDAILGKMYMSAIM